MNFLKAASSLFGDEEEAEENLLSTTRTTAPTAANANAADSKENTTGDVSKVEGVTVAKKSLETRSNMTEIEVEAAEPRTQKDSAEDAAVKDRASSTAPETPASPTAFETTKPTESMSAWSWGGILKTLAEKSEEVLQDYKRDLQEFTTGLKEETVAVVDKTKHVVNDLPQSLEVSVETAAHSAQESLDIVGHSIEDFGASVWRGTTEIIAQVKEAVALVEEEAALNAKQTRSNANASYVAASLSRGKYNRYEAQVSAMQRDSGTYCDEPEDTEDFAAWNTTFKLDDRKADIEAILKENAFMQELQSRIVPLIVEYDTFWTRYFYRLHKLQLAEDARADLVKRANTEQEEELSWDVDDAEAEENKPAAALISDEKRVDASQPKEEAKEDLLPAGAEGNSAAAAVVAKPDAYVPANDSSGPSTPTPKEGPTPSTEAPTVPSAIATTLTSELAATITTTPTSAEDDAGSDGSATSGGTSEWLVVLKEDSPEDPDTSAVAELGVEAKEAKLSPSGNSVKAEVSPSTKKAKSKGVRATPTPDAEAKPEVSDGEEKSVVAEKTPEKKGSKEDKRPANSEESAEEDWGEWE